MQNSASTDLYNLLVTKDFEPEILDRQGKPVTDPADADLFSFDWKTENNNYGTVVCLLGDNQELEVYFGDNLGRTMDGDDRQQWYDFLHQMKKFATGHLLSFNINNINRLKYSMQGMAAIKEGLFEGYYGTRKVSYSDQPKKTKLVIKHDRTLGENDARFRHIDSLFVETDQGERFRLPFKSLMGGRAMARHCAEGGNPYDLFGQHITQMISELATLSKFIRAAKSKGFTGQAAEMVESALRHYQALKSKAKKMVTQRGYIEEKKLFDPANIAESEQMVDNIKTMFIEQNLDWRIEEALPILARLRAPEMKELQEFAQHMGAISEGTWAIPDTPESMSALQNIMSQEMIVGPDATNVTEQLYDIFGDDVLFDRLKDLADKDPDADARPIIQQRLDELGINLDIDSSEADDEVSLNEATGTFIPVDIDFKKGVPREGKIHDIPGHINFQILPGLDQVHYEPDDYSDSFYFKDPITNGIFVIYFHGRLPRIRGVNGMSEQRVEEIAKTIALRFQEDIDTDSILMQKPSNMSSESKEIDLQNLKRLALV